MVQVNLFDLVKGFSEVIDMVSSILGRHHWRVACMTDHISQKLELDVDQRNKVVIAAMLHDIGVIPTHGLLDSMLFESDMAKHSKAGCILLQTCPALFDESIIIRYHHSPWKESEALGDCDRSLFFLGNIVNIADTIDKYSITGVAHDIVVEKIKKGRHLRFAPDIVDAALDVLSLQGEQRRGLYELSEPPLLMPDLKGDEVIIFSRLFSHIIDSLSPFTATHSSGVASTTKVLHELFDLPWEERDAIYVAGLLHDIGKMGVPVQYIEKGGPLNKAEFSEVKKHSRISLDILTSISGFEILGRWGALHHERLNGSGYPLGLKGSQIPIEARITAVADVFTALRENRPYRAGMSSVEALSIMDKMVKDGVLDGDVVECTRNNFEYIDHIRKSTQKSLGAFFRGFNNYITETCRSR